MRFSVFPFSSIGEHLRFVRAMGTKKNWPKNYLKTKWLHKSYQELMPAFLHLTKPPINEINIIIRVGDPLLVLI